MRKHFRAQKAKVLAKLPDIYPAHHETKAFATLDLDDETQALLDEIGPLYIAAAGETGAVFFAQTVRLSGAAFKTANDRIRKFIQNEVGRRIAGVNETTIKLVQGVIEDGFHKGESIQTVAKQLADMFDEFNRPPVDGVFGRADVIARTEMNSALNFGQFEGARQAQENGVTLFKSWLSSRDDRVRESHKALDAETHDKPIPFDQPFSNGMQFPGDSNGDPGEVINCFVQGTAVSGAFEGGLKARYAGPVRQLKTARGHRLTVTPNHPVLTQRGWIAAGEVTERDSLFTQGFNVGMSVQWDVDHENDGAPIEDVFDALATNATRRLAVIGALDLHGDGRFCDQEIDVVLPDWNLGPSGVTSVVQRVRDLHHVPADAVCGSSPTDSAPVQLGETGFSSASGIPSSATLAFNKSSIIADHRPLDGFGLGLVSQRNTALKQSPRDDWPTDAKRGGKVQNRGASQIAFDDVGRQRLATQFLAVGWVANLDTELGKASRQGVAAHADFAREMLHRSSGLISPDQVIEAIDLRFSGHVYDLQARDGWILADGIVSSNCRCTFEEFSSYEMQQRGLTP